MMRLKKIIYITLDILIGVAIGILLCLYINDQIVEQQNLQKEFEEKSAQQALTKALSILEGNGEILKSSQVSYPKVGEAYALIHNDDRNFSKDLYFGDSDDILNIAIGQFSQSGIPGEGRPILLAGHNGTHFKELRNFEEGDFVQIDTSYGTYIYQVNRMEIQAAAEFEHQAWDILGQDEEILILYTCYPFNTIDTPDRYFVYAHKVQGPVIEEDGTWKK